ncbi:MAG: flagellar export chaperone FlgN [Candidatus Gastranaerophilaceae bacterium]|jgi:hypothetical protein
MEILLELEQILDNQIQTFEKLEEKLTEKKTTIIKGDVKSLKVIDEQILSYSNDLKQILESRKLINKKLGDENKSLNQIIKEIEDKDIARRLENKRTILNDKVKKITNLNAIAQELIKHAMNLVKGTILIIAKALNPQKGQGAYDRRGHKNNTDLPSSISSVIKEA